ncbi:Cupin domain-containing protein [Rhodovastum atsumiense]|uniref:Cupin domain-containing protein n=1 Tax=Rhodovastum atsumiense TaxID=504468 RepID=A0A5M6IKA9_9PROT|nr:cupin domain-containing protein [Rhodovastum atsumiense]KAA5608309.1 cupin domain-containing protein [Rhodovastum atsumiense]CAH2605062.1 Cupin domain-containing protein [Rhodovastum atsumiense]
MTLIRSGNLLAAIPPELSEEQVHTLATAGAARVERIVSRGQASPAGFWYDQDQPEWVALLQGAAALEYADGTVQDLQAGDWVLIPAHVRHRVLRTSCEPAAVWLAVFLPG